MERKINNLIIPPECAECKKEKMDAVYCPLFPTLEGDVAMEVPCASIGSDKNELMVSGGRFIRIGNSQKREGIRRTTTRINGRAGRKRASN
jgi:hypothetical protein